MNGPQPRPRRGMRHRLTSWFSDPEYDRQVAAEQVAFAEHVRAIVKARMDERAADEVKVATVVLDLADPDLLVRVAWVDAGDGSARGLASFLPDDHPAIDG